MSPRQYLHSISCQWTTEKPGLSYTLGAGDLDNCEAEAFKLLVNSNTAPVEQRGACRYCLLIEFRTQKLGQPSTARLLEAVKPEVFRTYSCELIILMDAELIRLG